VIRWADQWMPMDIALGAAPGDVAKRVGRFRERAADAGREVPVTIVTFGDPTTETLHAYRDLGVTRAVLGAGRSGWDDPSTTMAYLDRYASFIPELAV
jgi:nucleotide-binding universal stress UspA family protein